MIDLRPGSVIVEAAGAEKKINALVEILATYGIVEMARTGRVAVIRGLRKILSNDEPILH